ncbi:Uncharacterised protein [Salmonella enterica subsp. diarizonae]|uniref:Uncharacterized protein n=1 Tax=Salmonella diarizonae TaxID=59204 RepID=A0A379U0W7_SALDZ|nr:Uncharacterised protein [Salmonella enterica subsp. diarizonae]
MRRGEVDILFSALILQAHFIGCRREKDVAFVIFDSDVVGMTRVMQRPGNKWLVRVTAVKHHRHFGALYQRQVQTEIVTGIIAGTAQPRAFAALRPRIFIEVKTHPVAAHFVDMAVDITGL